MALPKTWSKPCKAFPPASRLSQRARPKHNSYESRQQQFQQPLAATWKQLRSGNHIWLPASQPASATSTATKKWLEKHVSQRLRRQPPGSNLSELLGQSTPTLTFLSETPSSPSRRKHPPFASLNLASPGRLSARHALSSATNAMATMTHVHVVARRDAPNVPAPITPRTTARPRLDAVPAAASMMRATPPALCGPEWLGNTSCTQPAGSAMIPGKLSKHPDRTVLDPYEDRTDLARTIPNPDRTAPNPNGTAPNPDGTSPNPDRTPPNLDRIAPNPICPTPHQHVTGVTVPTMPPGCRRTATLTP